MCFKTFKGNMGSQLNLMYKIATSMFVLQVIWQSGCGEREVNTCTVKPSYTGPADRQRFDGPSVVPKTLDSNVPGQPERDTDDGPTTVVTTGKKELQLHTLHGSAFPSKSTANVFTRRIEMIKVTSRNTANRPKGEMGASSFTRHNLNATPKTTFDPFEKSFSTHDKETRLKSSSDPTKNTPEAHVPSTTGSMAFRKLINISLATLLVTNTRRPTKPLPPTKARSLFTLNVNLFPTTSILLKPTTDTGFDNKTGSYVTGNTVPVLLPAHNFPPPNTSRASNGYRLLSTLNSEMNACSYPIICDEDTPEFGKIPCCYECYQDPDVPTEGLKCCNGEHPSLALEPIFININGRRFGSTVCRHPLEYRYHGDQWESVVDVTLFPSYRMVSACPDTFSDADIKHKCENETLSRDFKILLEIAIANSEQGVVYKNIFCLICNGQTLTPDFKPFSLMVGVNTLSSDYSHIVNAFTADDLLDWRLQDIDITSSMATTVRAIADPILYNQIINMACGTPNSVYSDDIHECVGSNDTFKSMLKEACDRFQLAIVARAYRVPPRRYSNIACVLCAFGPRVQINPFPSCKRRDDDHSFDINVTPALRQFSKIMSEQMAKNFSKSNSDMEAHVNCSEKNFRKVQGSCRRVLCPKAHYSTQTGRCVPFLRSFNKRQIYFTFVTQVHNQTEDEYRSILQQVTQYLGNLGSTIVVRAEFTDGHGDKTCSFLTEWWIVILRRTSNDELLRLLDPLVNPSSSKQVLVSLDGLPLRTESENGSSFRCTHRQNVFAYQCKECQTDSRFQTFDVSTLTKQDYCKRTLLQPQDFTRGKGFIRVHVSKKIVHDYELDWLKNASPIVCIDELETRSPNNILEISSHKPREQKITKIVLFVVFSASIAVAIFSIILRLKLFKTSWRERK